MPRSRTIFISPVVALLAMGFALAAAQERAPAQVASGNRRAAPADPAAAQANAARMNELLDLWAAQSKKLKTLKVSIYRIDKDKAWGEEEHYVGRAAFRSPHFAFLDYRKVKLQVKVDPNNKAKRIVEPKKKNNELESTPHETILCNGAEIWHYKYATSQIIVYTLDNEMKRRALQEGPLPFLFNLKADEAKRRYAMKLHSEDNNRYLIMLQPRLPEDQEIFSAAWLSLDKQFLLPTRIVLISPDRKMQQDFVLSNLEANQPVEDRLFKGVNPGKPWKVERNPGRETNGSANPSSGRRPAGGQADRRPAAGGADPRR